MKLNTIYSYFVIILFAPLVGMLINKLILCYKSYKNLDTSNQLYKLTYRLTTKEFEIWCSEYLSNLGFINIALLPLGSTDGKKIICEKDSKKFYVECKRYSSSNSITPFHIEKLLGTMISDNIFNGIIITTGDICDDTILLLNKIKKPYSINIINSEELDISYTEYMLKAN